MTSIHRVVGILLAHCLEQVSLMMWLDKKILVRRKLSLTFLSFTASLLTTVKNIVEFNGIENKATQSFC